MRQTEEKRPSLVGGSVDSSWLSAFTFHFPAFFLHLLLSLLPSPAPLSLLYINAGFLLKDPSHPCLLGIEMQCLPSWCVLPPAAIVSHSLLGCCSPTPLMSSLLKEKEASGIIRLLPPSALSLLIKYEKVILGILGNKLILKGNIFA